MNFLRLRVIGFNPPQRMGAFLLGAIAGKLNQLVLMDIPILGDSSLSNDLKEGVVLHFGHKINALRNPLGKQAVVVIGSIIDHNGPRRKDQLPGDLDVGHLAFCNPRKAGKVAVMVQKEV
jgi:hypothetical protein